MIHPWYNLMMPMINGKMTERESEGGRDRIKEGNCNHLQRLKQLEKRESRHNLWWQWLGHKLLLFPLIALVYSCPSSFGPSPCFTLSSPFPPHPFYPCLPVLYFSPFFLYFLLSIFSINDTQGHGDTKSEIQAQFTIFAREETFSFFFREMKMMKTRQ